MTLSDEQTKAIDSILNWFNDPKQEMEFKLGGYAGTGKTTVIKSIIEKVKKTEVCAFTGKAVSVLRKKGCLDALTIHSLIYTPVQGKNGVIEFVLKDSLPSTDLIIVDEASMISESLYEDLISFQIPILWVGDPGQLEPVGDDVALMKEPDIILKEIHRQGEGSGILSYATHCREKKTPSRYASNTDNLDVSLNRILGYRKPIDVDQIICGFNKTRVNLNSQMRRDKGFNKSLLNIGEKLICLKNNSKVGIFNGMQFTLLEWKQKTSLIAWVRVKDDLDNIISFHTFVPQFGHQSTIESYIVNKEARISDYKDLSLLDYSYCITAHKSQGSEWESVCVIEELWPGKWDSARWRYTAITRASKKLLYLY